MLIRFGLGGQLSGSAGGLTAAHNRYGQYVRNRSVPVNPNSTRQQEVRNAFATATLAWRDLDDNERQLWRAYADQTPILNKLGETVIPTGQAMYVSTNTFRLGLGQTILDAAPSTPGRSSLGNITSVVITEGAEIVLTTVGATALGPAICQIGPALSPGKNFFAGPYSLYATVTLTATGGTFAEPAQVPYGNTVDGQRRPVRILGSDAEGRLSDAYQEIVTVTA